MEGPFAPAPVSRPFPVSLDPVSPGSDCDSTRARPVTVASTNAAGLEGPAAFLHSQNSGVSLVGLSGYLVSNPWIG